MATGDFALKVPQMQSAAHLYGQGWSVRQIADSFGVSANAVKNALVHMGVQLREKHQARALRWSFTDMPPLQGINP